MNKETPTFFNPYNDLKPKGKCHSVDVAFVERVRQLKAELDASMRLVKELSAKATARASKSEDLEKKAEAIEKAAAMFNQRAEELAGSFEPEEGDVESTEIEPSRAGRVNSR